MPDFPSFDLSWDTFEATSSGLLGTGISDINARTEADVNVKGDCLSSKEES